MVLVIRELSSHFPLQFISLLVAVHSHFMLSAWVAVQLFALVVFGVRILLIMEMLCLMTFNIK